VLHKCTTGRNVWSMPTKTRAEVDREPCGNGPWEPRAFGGYDTVTGKRIRRTKTFVGSERTTAKALGAFVQEVESSDVTRRGDTVGQLLDEWLNLGTSKQKPRTVPQVRSARLVNDFISYPEGAFTVEV
jgi:hypothetical protein